MTEKLEELFNLPPTNNTVEETPEDPSEAIDMNQALLADETLESQLN